MKRYLILTIVLVNIVSCCKPCKCPKLNTSIMPNIELEDINLTYWVEDNESI